MNVCNNPSKITLSSQCPQSTGSTLNSLCSFPCFPQRHLLIGRNACKSLGEVEISESTFASQ